MAGVPQDQVTTVENTLPLVAQVAPTKTIELSDVFRTLIDGYGESGNDSNQSICKKTITEYLKQEIKNHACAAKYNLLVLHDSSILVKSDADNIYNAITKFQNKNKPILLILYSGGGSAGSAYLIGKLCREYSNGSFIVSVPRAAKSAATLLACAANEIHMGSLSELGPIDPQIDKLPALGLKHSIEHIAQLVKETPEASKMFAQYLHDSLNIIDLGYYERIAESAMQYAERLLDTHQSDLPSPAKFIANTLVYQYKDHGFVIDKAEAEKIFGEKVIKKNTEEYELGNSIYKALDTIESFADLLKLNFYFIGSVDSEPVLSKRKREKA